jgi:AraC-like DNA-binding protein
MDPLSDVLSLLKPRSYMVRGFDVGGPWSIRFDPKDGIKCYSLLSGQCWLAMDGVPEPVLLKSGDCILLPSGRAFRLASDLALPPVDIEEVVVYAETGGGVTTFNGGGDCFGIGGWFDFGGKNAEILLGVLPPIVLIREESDKAALRWCLERIMHELLEPQPGGVLVAQHLAHMLLVQALRLHLAEGSGGGVGWLFALADKQMSAAINSMHSDPAHHWTVHELAKHAGMSRSTFAVKFKETVGASPIEYLARWRMLVAGDRLVNSSDPVSAIALSLGYESESAFSTAFKRVMGCSPRQYSRATSPASPSHGESENAGADRLEPVAG